MNKSLLSTTLTLFCSTLLMAQSPKAIYKLAGNANDESGNAHHGVATDVTYAADKGGNPNSAAVFNGSTSKIVIADTAVFNVGKESFTLAFWFKTSNTTKTYMIPFATGLQGFKPGIGGAVSYNHLGDVTFGVGAPNPTLPILGDPANSVLIATKATTFNDGVWHLAVLVLDKANNKAKIIVDNVLQEIEKVTVFGSTGGTLSTDSKSLDITGLNYSSVPTDLAYIGSTSNTGINQTFDGSLDEVQFFNYALSDAQAGALYTGGTTGLVKNIMTNGFEVWPTIVDDQMHVTSPSTSFEYQILAIDGRMIKSGQSINTSTWNMEFLPSGSYWLVLKDASGESMIKFIKN